MYAFVASAEVAIFLSILVTTATRLFGRHIDWAKKLIEGLSPTRVLIIAVIALATWTAEAIFLGIPWTAFAGSMFGFATYWMILPWAARKIPQHVKARLLKRDDIR